MVKQKFNYTEHLINKNLAWADITKLTILQKLQKGQYLDVLQQSMIYSAYKNNPNILPNEDANFISNPIYNIKPILKTLEETNKDLRRFHPT